MKKEETDWSKRCALAHGVCVGVGVLTQRVVATQYNRLIGGALFSFDDFVFFFISALRSAKKKPAKSNSFS